MSQETRQITAADGHTLDLYVAMPTGSFRGGLVVVQEIFGVNHHIRAVADDFAAQGYLAVAPALFDRAEPGLELDYSPESIARGAALAQKIGAGALQDVAAALTHLEAETGRAGAIVGYCLGGTLAWLAATRLSPKAAICYYGGRIATYADETPHCPVLMHFGERDAHIPLSDVEKIKVAHPEVVVHTYPAGHGFNCTERADYDPASASLARECTLEFLGQNMR